MKKAVKGGVRGSVAKNFTGSVLQFELSVGTCLMLIGRTGLTIVPGANQNCLAVELGGRGDWRNLAAYFTCEGTSVESVFTIMIN